MRYDSRFNVYVMTSDELSKYSIDYLNKFQHKLLIEFENTRGLSTNFIRSISNNKIAYKIVGGYDKARVAYWNEENRKDNTNRTGRYKIPGVCYMDDCNIYKRDELTSIIEKMETIENGIMPGWSQIKKALYVYERLREEIIYHPEYEYAESVEIRSLRGLVTNKTVCAGFALIYKEIMERLGISCDFVQGVTKKGISNELSNHCWNILNIHGRKFPIDLTWDATSYREGETDSFKRFSSVNVFRNTHFPWKGEPLQDYSGLCGLKRAYVKRTIESFKRKKDYSKSVITVNSIDGDRLAVAQVERIENVYGKTKPMYRYVVAKQGKDGRYSDYRMVYSESNLLILVKQLQWKKIKLDDVKLKCIAELFSYSNLNKARAEGTSYIGRGLIGQVFPKGYKIERNKYTSLRFPVLEKELIRRNDERCLISEVAESRVVDTSYVYSGYVSKFTSNGYREYKVYSDRALLDSYVSGYEDVLFNERYLDKRLRDAGGYIGFVDDNGRVVDSSELREYFDIRNPGDIKRSDVIFPGSVYNDNFVDIIDFYTLKDICLKYDVQISNNNSGSRFVDKETGKVVTDKKFETICRFAHHWCGFAGIKWMFDEELHGLNYAFNDGAAMVYDYLIKNSIKSLETSGTIDFSKFDDEDMLNRGYDNYKYSGQILKKILHFPHVRENIFNFCKLQVDAYSGDSAYRRAQTYVDSPSSYQREIFDMLGNDNSVPKTGGNGTKK